MNRFVLEMELHNVQTEFTHFTLIGNFKRLTEPTLFVAR